MEKYILDGQFYLKDDYLEKLATLVDSESYDYLINTTSQGKIEFLKYDNILVGVLTDFENKKYALKGKEIEEGCYKFYINTKNKVYSLTYNDKYNESYSTIVFEISKNDKEYSIDNSCALAEANIELVKINDNEEEKLLKDFYNLSSVNKENSDFIKELLEDDYLLYNDNLQFEYMISDNSLVVDTCDKYISIKDIILDVQEKIKENNYDFKDEQVLVEFIEEAIYNQDSTMTENLYRILVVSVLDAVFKSKNEYTSEYLEFCKLAIEGNMLCDYILEDDLDFLCYSCLDLMGSVEDSEKLLNSFCIAKTKKKEAEDYLMKTYKDDFNDKGLAILFEIYEVYCQLLKLYRIKPQELNEDLFNKMMLRNEAFKEGE